MQNCLSKRDIDTGDYSCFIPEGMSVNEGEAHGHTMAG